ncbi:predicted protein [Histoplasma mississippiense (nom. inval.)]|uniref:predicted protein n=1 Tax=Ajellomyces capsulatus (strain NAm1 / WU24) TaxID=2059318 RepID=UPI000157BDB8|nr:predicted protein [Histoplasma mississippiense (nom. inval.)]EDN06187.1 predicted protein [Histoplasma mississippiense (nom. inval.)]
MANHYVFCKVEKVDSKVRIFPEEKMDPSSSIHTMAEIAGFLHPWFNHHCRYGGGLILNKSGLVSNAEQNLVLKHASICMFLEHYIPRTVGINMQALISSLDLNSPLIQAITRIGRWLDKWCPQHLTDAQKATVEPAASRQSRSLRGTCLLYKYWKQVRKEFDDEQAVINIEQQLSSEALDEEAMETLQEEQILPALIYLLSKLLTWLTSRSVEEELQ